MIPINLFILKVVRVKARINPKDKGNKVIIVNLVVEDKDFRPIEYPWSGWWDKQTVRMIAEVCVSNKMCGKETYTICIIIITMMSLVLSGKN